MCDIIHDSPPTVSVMFPTYNRMNSLILALRSAAQLNYPQDKYEVIVIDDGSSDGTQEAVRAIQEECGSKILYFRQRRKGITAARNLGLSKASGEYLIFTDDDCIFEKEWLWKMLRYFDSTQIGAVGGPDQCPPNASFLAQCVDYTTTSFIGTGGVRRKTGLIVAKYYPRGCNMMVPKHIVKQVGGFDPTLQAGEEIELGYRIRTAGYRLVYAAEALVWHQRRDKIFGFMKQMFTRGYTRVELARRHRELLEPSYLLPPVAVLTLFFLLILSILLCSGVSRPAIHNLRCLLNTGRCRHSWGIPSQ